MIERSVFRPATGTVITSCILTREVLREEPWDDAVHGRGGTAPVVGCRYPSDPIEDDFVRLYGLPGERTMGEIIRRDEQSTPQREREFEPSLLKR